MQFKKNRFLKSLFIMVFVTGLLSPALGNSLNGFEKNSFYKLNSHNHLSIIINLFSEQFNESEEAEEDDKPVLSFTEIYREFISYIENSYTLLKPRHSDNTIHPCTVETFTILYCKYLI